MSNEPTQRPTKVDEEIIPNLTAWATEAGIDNEAMKTEIIAYMTAIGAIAIDSKENTQGVNAVAFHTSHGKHHYRLVVERTLNKTDKGSRIIIP